jgi:hypothetical protein
MTEYYKIHIPAYSLCLFNPYKKKDYYSQLKEQVPLTLKNNSPLDETLYKISQDIFDKIYSLFSKERPLQRRRIKIFFIVK